MCPVYQLVFQQSPETFHWRVIMAVALAAHGALHPVCSKLLLIRITGLKLELIAEKWQNAYSSPHQGEGYERIS